MVRTRSLVSQKAMVFLGKLFSPKPIRTIFFLNLSADSNSMFVAANFFLNDSHFWCDQSSITRDVAVHVHVLWPVCAHTIPFRMLVSLMIHDNMYIF